MPEHDQHAASWTVDDLLDGDPLRTPRQLSMVWTQLHHHLFVNDAGVVKAFCAVVTREQKTPAKLVALHLASTATGELAQLIDDLLIEDRLLYAHYRGSKLVALAIQSRWRHLDETQRASVIANIEASDMASPSFADMRALIAAIPAHERPTLLESRLTELGGARMSDDSEGFTRSDEDDEPEAAPRSLAERMADVPTWLKAEPIPWDRVSAALLEDENAQRVDEHDRPARLLTAETAIRVANTALESLAEFRQRPGIRDDLINALDIALALPPHHEDDELNSRFVHALRTHVFATPVETEAATHALMLVRPWHWRRDAGCELLLRIVRDLDDERVVATAIRPLGYMSETVIAQGLESLADTRTDAKGKGVARAMGQLLGARAPWVAALAELLLTWLASPPTGRFLASATAWNEFLTGVAFALKNTAHHAPELDPVRFSQIASALWKSWQSPRSKSGEARHGLALFLMSPIHHVDRGESIAVRYWPVLKALFEEILTRGDAEDVSGALFHFDLDELTQTIVEELASILRGAARRPIEPASDSRHRIAQLLRDIGKLESCPRTTASEIHQTLVLMGARKEALDVERRWSATR